MAKVNSKIKFGAIAKIIRRGWILNTGTGGAVCKGAIPSVEQ
jgi:hypothetical protein